MTKEYIVKITNSVQENAFEEFENDYSPEELIRCKECLYWSESNHGMCGLCGQYHSEIWYCAGARAKWLN